MVNKRVWGSYRKNLTEAHVNGIEDPIDAARVNQRVERIFHRQHTIARRPER